MSRVDEIEAFKNKISHLNDRVAGLEKKVTAYENSIIRLGEMLSDQKEKYAALLERHISMMEEVVKPNDPSIEVRRIICDIEGMITKWFQENAYDYQLDNCIQELKKKYL